MVEPVFSKNLYTDEGLFSQGIKAGGLVFLAQDARGVNGSIRDPSDASEQARQTLENIKTGLRAAGQELENLVALTIFLSDYRDIEAAAAVIDDAFVDSEALYPATTFIGVMSLGTGCRIKIDAVATSSADREQISAPGVSYAFRTRSHGVRVENLLFLSGVDASGTEGAVCNPVNIETQTVEILNRIETVLSGQKLSLGDICRTFMFSPSTAYRPGYTEARKKRYHGIFHEHEFPPNSGIYVKDLGKDILLRSVVVAYRGTKTTIHSSKVREAPGLFSQGVRAGNWMFVAGQDAVGFGGQVEAMGNLAGQTEAALRHIKDIVEEAGGCMDDVVKTTVYLLANQSRSIFAERYGNFFKTHCRSSALPAGLITEVRELSPWCLVEIDALALLKK